MSLVEYDEEEVPHYAILSHTWGANDEEVTYKDFTEDTGGGKAGWEKIEFCRKQAAIDNLQHFWIDTCCIDKASSAELTEAVNSMFRWYHESAKCYVYLSDVSIDDFGENSDISGRFWDTTFQESRWFTRGWTLQELIAPTSVEFCSREGTRLGDKKSLEGVVSKTTGIPVQALRGNPLSGFSVTERRIWAAKRKTTRKEDEAYCLLGIFGVYIPTIYGEGDHAFVRLDEAIDRSQTLSTIELSDSSQRQQEGKLSMEEYNCLRSLCPSGIDYESQKNQNPLRVPNTCLWTLQNPKYLEWRDNDTKRLLWISADPGCGKSVLARCIVDEDLPSLFQTGPSKRVLYYFFKDTSTEQRSASRAICTILHQLFVSHPQLIRYALRKYNERGAALSTTFAELWSILTAAATDPRTGDTICVFDALDECNDQEQSRLIECLEDFCLRQQASSSASRVKFLITSRPYFKIRRRFDRVLEASNNIELAGNDESASIKKEIDLVIKHQVANLKRETRLAQKVSDHLEKRLLETEHRTYLWLHLLWNIIRKNLSGTKSEIDRLINNLPDDIQGSYEVLLQKCPDPVFARKVLQIVLVANRPLTLTEIDVALHIDEQTVSYADLELEGPSRLQETLPSRCGLIVSIIQSKVYFIHQTVKEFLLGEIGTKRLVGRVWQQSLDLGESHHLLAKICLRSTSFSEVELHQANLCNAVLPKDIREMEPNTYCQSHMFLSYSAVYWADHFRDQKRNEGIKIVEHLLEISNYRSVTGQEGIDYGTILHAASLGGHDIIVQMLLEKGAEVNAQGGCYGNALQAASVGGYKIVVQMLLEKGAEVNAQGGKYSNALRAASVGGHEIVVQMLLEKGAEVNAQGGWYGNALYSASLEGHETVVQMLLEKGAEVNAQGSYYGNALQAASVGGYKTVVQILLEKGAEVNAQGGEYSNALRAASVGGHKIVVQMLLEKGAEVNAQGGRYGNALQSASLEGHKTVVQMLLEKGAEVNAQGGYYGNTLQAASAEGHETVVQILLEKGAEVNAQGGYYGNALQAASAEGHEIVVQILLEKGAEVNAQGGEYSNALRAASVRGYKTVVQMLLEKGAEVNAQGGYYGNTLQAASAEGHETVVQILLEKGAEVNAQGGYYGNALQAASLEGHETVVQMLLEKGAEVNAQGGYYGNALYSASLAGHETVVQILLEKGAEVNAQGGRYGNALQAASAEGYKTVVQILLEKGAEVNAQGGRYGNALQAASVGGHETVVQMLLEKGAEVNTQGGEYSNALQAASVGGYKTVVQILLEKGAIRQGNELSL